MSGFRFHWGHGILAFILLFLFACAFLLWYAAGVKWNLVENEVYQKDAIFSEKLRKMANADRLASGLVVVNRPDSCYIDFSNFSNLGRQNGVIRVYRPSDERLDVMQAFEVPLSGKVAIPRGRLQKGRYVLQIDWMFDTVPCYREIDLMVQ